MLEIRDLHVNIDEKPILRGIQLQIRAGEVHAIMGPNGSGKSTLAKTIAGHPAYQVTQGDILFDINGFMKSLVPLKPDERAKEGIFIGFQYPVEVPGLSNFNFLHLSFNAICRHQGIAEMDEKAFTKFLNTKLKLIEMNPDFLTRSVNVGFSGGEKKRNEILQMAVLSPRLALLDETDSGLDIDALRTISHGINKLRNRRNAIVLVTHYQRFLQYVTPDYVHVLADGQIVRTGGRELAEELERVGYDWLKEAKEVQQ